MYFLAPIKSMLMDTHPIIQETLKLMYAFTNFYYIRNTQFPMCRQFLYSCIKQILKGSIFLPLFVYRVLSLKPSLLIPVDTFDKIGGKKPYQQIMSYRLLDNQKGIAAPKGKGWGPIC